MRHIDGVAATGWLRNQHNWFAFTTRPGADEAKRQARDRSNERAFATEMVRMVRYDPFNTAIGSDLTSSFA
ncbi:putative cell wall binding protein [Anopheles sinensis]|uniref:Putative cell wall binding protein n=1 Tax=Anopheles sinensis TaxID=74873 RepID=A0A084WRF4_ANOSI|nr:putative cell wall binding protein [Anopheles sinensis]